MYIIGSIAIISFIEIIVAIFFRSWQLKRGSIDAAVHSDGPLGVAHHMKRAQWRILEHIVLFVKHWIPVVGGLFHKARLFVAQKTGAMKLKDMVDGKMPPQNGNGSAPSLYLKDITEHKNNIQKNKKVF